LPHAHDFPCRPAGVRPPLRPDWTANAGESFHFVAFGGTTYAIPAAYELFEHLLAYINASESALSIHVGHIKRVF